MRKSLVTAVMAVCISTPALAKNMSFESNPLGLALGIYNGIFLFDVNDKLSVGPAINYWNFSLSGDDFTWLGLSGRTEYMPSGNNAPGLYVSGAGNYSTFSIDTVSDGVNCEGKVGALAATVTGGYKYISTGGFIAKVGAGYGIGSVGNFEGTCSDDTSYSESVSVPYGGLAFEWTLGYKF